MSSLDVNSSVAPLSTLPLSHDSREDTEACISTKIMESSAEGKGGNFAQDEGHILSIDVNPLEDGSARLTARQTPLGEITTLSSALLLILCFQTVVAAGLLLLAYFGSYSTSAWLFGHFVLVKYAFFFTQIVGLRLYHKIIQLSNVEGLRTRLLKNFVVTMIGMLLLVAMVSQMTRIYNSISEGVKDVQLCLEGLREIQQEQGDFKDKFLYCISLFAGGRNQRQI
ncbi:uncharacterized protein Z520_00524 [Fonsecaea multimorphosa CBS 102226]|uniref:Uncharacterized protein n=1 Tax=Fonsecaea multimorphosa CBS 102226 TaxID=1442371 RepID=A0A0D2KCG0_9EURO|nr:uncharacterized protein Z520_00524 [Fonsecaea multimorphosa CBS 102226]KIY03833.1 hypothetical protein Z520_00524 [Fonsecaea multimorphosa CBS 102226]OAL32522.1 hypothetical protein AYO22_00544 [Fonsecaea multimorphosa]